jgi:Caspase domain
MSLGHGSRVRDQDGDEEDGYDETLVPVDFQRSGQIRDDDIYKMLVKPMRSGVTMTCLMDCCHSGTVLDLPYRFTADGDVMTRNDRFGFFDNAEAVIGAACCLYCLLDIFGAF